MKAKVLCMFPVTLLVLAAAAAQGEVKEISFRRTTDNSLKLYCTQIEGKVQTAISCDGEAFTPDAIWEPIDAEQVCFQT